MRGFGGDTASGQPAQDIFNDHTGEANYCKKG